MVNRVMQGKALKAKRELRRRPRPMNEDVPGSFIPHNGEGQGKKIPARLLAEGVSAGRQPNRELMQGYQHRAASLAVNEEDINLLIRLFYGRTPFKGTPPGRMEALDRLMELDIAAQRSLVQQVSRIEDVTETLISFTIVSNRVQRARLYRNAQSTVFVILHENFREGVVRTSMPYQYRPHLIEDFCKNKVRWVEYGECATSPRKSR